METFQAVKRRIQVPNPAGDTSGTDALRAERAAQMRDEREAGPAD